MYHIKFIEETSKENEQIQVSLQEKEQKNKKLNCSSEHNLIQRTTQFLHKYLDQPNCVRIFISKN